MTWTRKTAKILTHAGSIFVAAIAIVSLPSAMAQTFSATTPSASFLSQASRIALADFNGDGFSDQVRLGYQGGNAGNPLYLEIYLGNGDGTFGPASGYPSTFVKVDQCAAPVALATYGRDVAGNTSVALLCYDSLQIWYPYQTHASVGPAVTFNDTPAARQVINLSSGGVAMAVGDFTGRGAPGIAVLQLGPDGQHARSIAVYSPPSACELCTSTSAFPQMVPLPVVIDTTSDVGAGDVGKALTSFVSADSARANLAIATVIPGTCGGTLSTYYSSGGGGNFVHGASAPIPQPFCASALAAGDLDGDGYADIIVGGGKASNTPTAGTGFLSVYLGGSNAAIYPLIDEGKASFTDALVPFDSTGLAALDMNGDGLVDIVESGTYGALTRIYSGVGDGTFSAAKAVGENVVTLPTGTQVTGVFSVRAGSTNLDGSPDLVLLDRVVSSDGGTTPQVGGLFQVFTGRTGSSTTTLAQGIGSPTPLIVAKKATSAVAKKGTTSTLKVSQWRSEGEGSSSSVATLQATVSPEQASGSVQFFDATTQAWVGSAPLANGFASLTTPLLGTHYFVAMYYGDSTYNGSQSDALAIAPAKLTPYVSLQVSPEKPKPGDPVTFTVNVSDGGATPGGSILLVDNVSGATLGTLTLDSTGNGTFSTSSLPAASYDVVAQYSGDNNYNAGESVDEVFTVGVPLVPATLSLTASTASAATGSSVMLNASIAGNGNGVPSGKVSFQIDGVTVAQGMIAGGTALASVLAPNPGVHRLQAVFAGDGVFSAAYSNVLPLTTHGAVLQFTPGSAVTLAGVPSDDLHGGFGGDGGPATSAYLRTPSGLTSDGAGNVYIADEQNNVIRKVGFDGNITTVAGVPYVGNIYGNTVFSGDGGPATQAYLDNPSSMVLDATGNLIIADYSNNVVRRVDATTGIITTIAGNHYGSGSYNGDGAGTSTLLYHPSAVASDAAGNIFIADSGNNLIRKLDTAGMLTTIAGNYYAYHSGQNPSGVPATSVALYQPMGVAVDAAGNVYIADTNNGLIRKVDTSGVITTIAGGASYAAPADNVPGLSTTLNRPQQITLDSAGNIYFAEAGNEVIRELDTKGVITTPIGFLGSSPSPWSHFDPSGEPSNFFQLVVPSSVAVLPDGSLVATDTFNQTVIRSGSAGAVLFGPSPIGTTSPAQNVVLSNVGDAPLVFSATPFTVTGDYTVTAATTSACNFAMPMAPGDHCNISVAYTNAGGGLSGAITFSANVAGTPTVLLKTNTTGVPTVTALYTPGATASFGQDLLFIATVQAQGPQPAGDIAFYDGATLLGKGIIGSGGYATLDVTTLSVGTHSITAQYLGSGYYAASTSDAQSLLVTGPTTGTALTVSGTGLNAGSSLTMTVVVTGDNAAPVNEGAVIFYDGSTALATRAVRAAGVASYTTASLSVGSHSITAVYQGTVNFAGSTSNAANVTVSNGGGGYAGNTFDYTVTVAGLPAIVHRGQTGTAYVDYSLVGNSGGSLQPTCGTLPSYATCSFNPSFVILSGPVTDQPVTLTISTTLP